MQRAAGLALALAAALAAAAPPPQPQPAPQRQVLACSAPQPRAFESRLLAAAPPGVLLQPPFAVLHRCDGGAGCCLGALSCQPLDQEEVRLVFMATDVVGGGSGGEDYRVVTATNHTACGCLDLTERRER